jgi:hypothetical protein
MKSEAFQEFEQWFLNADSWAIRKEGPNLKVIGKLSSDEKVIAEDMLLNRLDFKDSWIIYGLGELRSKKAESILRASLNKYSDSILVSIYWALWMISKDIVYFDYLCKFIDKNKNEFVLIESIFALESFPIDKSLNVFTKSLNHESYLVRYNSFQILGRLFKFTGIFADSLVNLCERNLRSDNFENRNSAIKDVLEMINSNRAYNAREEIAP